MKKLFITICLFLPVIVFAKHLYPEKHYQNEYAKTLPNAQVEVVAPDGTRCDILTSTHAIEVDFAKKWGEAIGQSLNYALQFNKRAGILLILESSSDYKYFVRVNSIVKHFNLPIDVYTISPKEVSATKNDTEETGEYWISKSGKRHNKSCRYFKNSKGGFGDKDTGTPCKVCGG